MPLVSSSQTVPGPLSAVEMAWYDAVRWPEWVVGLERVATIEPGWPSEAGASVTWHSNPAGRGTVREEVVSFEPGGGQRLRVLDDLVEGEQRVAFVPEGNVATRVTLSLVFRRRRGGLFIALVDFFFSRRAMNDALTLTLQRFAAAIDLDSAR